jgi:hypothetical protein
VLERGPQDPASLAWLWANWGTTWPLRHVTARGDYAAVGDSGQIEWRFHAADWSPWAGLRTIRVGWSALQFKLEPDYELPVAAAPERGPSQPRSLGASA